MTESERMRIDESDCKIENVREREHESKAKHTMYLNEKKKKNATCSCKRDVHARVRLRCVRGKTERKAGKMWERAGPVG